MKRGRGKRGKRRQEMKREAGRRTNEKGGVAEKVSLPKQMNFASSKIRDF